MASHTLRCVFCSFPFKRASKFCSQTEGVGCRFQVLGENRCSVHSVKVMWTCSHIDYQSGLPQKLPKKGKKQNMQSERMWLCVAVFGNSLSQYCYFNWYYALFWNHKAKWTKYHLCSHLTWDGDGEEWQYDAELHTGFKISSVPVSLRGFPEVWTAWGCLLTLSS